MIKFVVESVNITSANIMQSRELLGVEPKMSKNTAYPKPLTTKQQPDRP